MNLIELAEQIDHPAEYSVPDWMLGAFSRRSLSFAEGMSDTDTRVFWLQSRGLTIDLRLPKAVEQTVLTEAFQNDPARLRAQTDLEGWYAHTRWQNERLSWIGGSSYQLHNRWPEPAELRRIGNCMIEFAPSGAYVEDWRMLNPQAGPLIGLELEAVTDLDSGLKRPRAGALIINADYAGWVLGREDTELESRSESENLSLYQLVMDASAAQRRALLDFQTLVAKRDSDGIYRTQHSLHPEQVGQFSISLEGFSVIPDKGRLIQRVEQAGQRLELIWRIDCLESAFPYTLSTPVSDQSAQKWRQQESNTLDRYTRYLLD